MNVFRSALLVLAAATALAANPPSWTEPIKPFRIAGNLYYVGTAELASFLFTTPEGHILLDVPLEENVEGIVESIEALGFNPKDIRILINSHAHFDHIGGMAAVREMTGAKVALMGADAELAARGGRNDFAFGDDYSYPPLKADRILSDGDTVALGGVTLTALATPGHTKGGTTWVTEVVEGGKPLRVVIANSMTAPGYQLVGNEQYPNIVEDFRMSFERLGQLEADIFLGPHAGFFKLREKLARGEEGTRFIDREGLKNYIEWASRALDRQVARQRETIAVETVLDAFHQAAARADGEAYFDLLTPDGVYIGTDASERWSVEQFRGYAMPYFESGRGWTYVPASRHVTLAAGGEVAWFDEILENAKYGTTRGTGVLVKREEGWKIAQYHLTIPIPNELAGEVVAKIRGE